MKYNNKRDEPVKLRLSKPAAANVEVKSIEHNKSTYHIKNKNELFNVDLDSGKKDTLAEETRIVIF